MITIKNEEHYNEVIEFAKKAGKYEQLRDRLEYLANYASGDGVQRTECVLAKDFAPYSFEFSMYRVARSVSLHVLECEDCGAKYKDEHVWDACPAWPEGASKSCGGKLRVVGVEHTKVERSFWFNGGLIFHGKHDGGGNGGAPTFSVNLTPADGWEIHT